MKTSTTIIILIVIVSLLLTTVYEADAVSLRARRLAGKRGQPPAAQKHRISHTFIPSANENKKSNLKTE